MLIRNMNIAAELAAELKAKDIKLRFRLKHAYIKIVSSYM